MVCLADPGVRDKTRRDIKTMIEKRLTYRKEVLLRDEIPPIPNVRRTQTELAKSPVYKRTKTLIPRRINRILIDKSRQVYHERKEIEDEEEEEEESSVSVYKPGYPDSDHDFGYYSRSKRKKSTTIQDLTAQLKETRRLLDVLQESDDQESRAKESPEVATVTRELMTSRDKTLTSRDMRGVRRKVDLTDDTKRRPAAKIADFVSANRDQLDCESITSDQESPERHHIVSRTPYKEGAPNKEGARTPPPPSGQFDVISSYGNAAGDLELDEFERLEQELAQRGNISGGSKLEESDPFTDSDYAHNISLQEELDVSKEYESDRFSMCSEKITHLEARKMLSESEQMFSAMLSALDTEPEDSFLLNERKVMEEDRTRSEIDEIMSIPSSIEDLRFDKEELPLLKTDTESTVTDTVKVMMPERKPERERPSLRFSKTTRESEQESQPQANVIKPVAKKPEKGTAKENIDFNNYENDLNEIENLLFKYDEYRLEQEQKKTVPVSPGRKIADGIGKKKSPVKVTADTATETLKKKEIKTGIAKGAGVKKPTATKKPLIAPTKPTVNSKSPSKSPGAIKPQPTSKISSGVSIKTSPGLKKPVTASATSPVKSSIASGIKPTTKLSPGKPTLASSPLKASTPDKKKSHSKIASPAPIVKSKSPSATKPVSPTKASVSKPVSPSKTTTMSSPGKKPLVQGKDSVKPSNKETNVAERPRVAAKPSKNVTNPMSTTKSTMPKPAVSKTKPSATTKTDPGSSSPKTASETKSITSKPKSAVTSKISSKPPISFRAVPPKTLTRMSSSGSVKGTGNYVKSAGAVAARKASIDSTTSNGSVSSSRRTSTASTKTSEVKKAVKTEKPTASKPSVVPKPVKVSKPSISKPPVSTKPAFSTKPAVTPKVAAPKPTVASNVAVSKPSVTSKLATKPTSASKQTVSKTTIASKPVDSSTTKPSSKISPPKVMKPVIATSKVAKTTADGPIMKKNSDDSKSAITAKPSISSRLSAGKAIPTKSSAISPPKPKPKVSSPLKSEDTASKATKSALSSPDKTPATKATTSTKTLSPVKSSTAKTPDQTTKKTSYKVSSPAKPGVTTPSSKQMSTKSSESPKAGTPSSRMLPVKRSPSKTSVKPSPSNMNPSSNASVATKVSEEKTPIKKTVGAIAPPKTASTPIKAKASLPTTKPATLSTKTSPTKVPSTTPSSKTSSSPSRIPSPSKSSPAKPAAISPKVPESSVKSKESPSRTVIKPKVFSKTSSAKTLPKP